MSKKSSDDHTVIMSDEYINESGLQGGKVISEHIILGSFIIGIPFFIIGSIALIAMLFDFGFPINAASVILCVIVTIIGLLLVIGGYSIYKEKQIKK